MTPGYERYRQFVLKNSEVRNEVIEYKQKQMNDSDINILDFLRLIEEIRELKDLKEPNIDFIRGYN